MTEHCVFDINITRSCALSLKVRLQKLKQHIVVHSHILNYEMAVFWGGLAYVENVKQDDKAQVHRTAV